MGKVAQVQALILEGIRHGRYPVGSRLPSLRKLAQETHANPNTVAQAYRELAERGVLRSVQGKGTFVLLAPNSDDLPSSHDAVRQELERIVQRAFALGIGPEEFVRMAEGAATIDPLPRGPRLVFVECNPFDTEEIAENITRVLQLRVAPLLIDELQADPEGAVRGADLVITTPFHIDEVDAALQGATHVMSVNVTATTRTLVELARIPTGARIVVLGSNAGTLTRLVRMVKTHGRQGPVAARLVDDPDVSERLATADVVVDSLGIHTRVVPLVEGAKIVTVHFQLESNSIEFLKARVQDLFPEAGSAAVGSSFD